MVIQEPQQVVYAPAAASAGALAVMQSVPAAPVVATVLQTGSVSSGVAVSSQAASVKKEVGGV